MYLKTKPELCLASLLREPPVTGPIDEVRKKVGVTFVPYGRAVLDDPALPLLLLDGLLLLRG